MNNIEYLILEKQMLEHGSYSDEDMINIIKQECVIHGGTIEIVMCMEELAELSEVIVKNSIYGQIDRWHTAEEIADCCICCKKLHVLFNTKNKEYLDNIGFYRTDNLLNICILNLNNSIIMLSKCIRNKPNADMKIYTILRLINETIQNLMKYYDIAFDDISKIIDLKINRMEKRNIVATTTPPINDKNDTPDINSVMESLDV